MKCPHCEEEIAGITCPACDEETPEGAQYCMMCGAPLARPETGEAGDDAFDLDSRVLCPDGTCTGIIVGGKCTECGKPYAPGGQTRETPADEEEDAAAEPPAEETAKDV